MNKRKKVSVMMLTYNHDGYIRKALDSVVSQVTEFDFEVIIGDDYSTDSTRDIIKEYCTKYPNIIKPIFRNKNIGASKNVVSCLKKCKGEYVAFLEGDDFWVDKYKLQKQVEFLDKNGDYSGVVTQTIVVDRYGSPMVTGPKILDHELRTPKDFVDTAYPYNQFKFIGALMTRNIWHNDEIVRYLLQTQIVTDQIIFAYSVLNGKIGLISDIAAAYRWVPSHGNNYSSQKAEYMNFDRIKSFKTILMFYPRCTYSKLYLRISRDYWQLFNYYSINKLYKEFIKLWLIKMNFIEKLFYVRYYFVRKITGAI